jgi:GT2 family glycosyltransferase
MPYGDQAIFVKKEAFHQVGGFPDIPTMEDFELIRRLRRRGTIRIVPASVITSARRWQALGVLRTVLINQAMIVGYLLGVSPTRLARWYRRHTR